MIGVCRGQSSLNTTPLAYRLRWKAHFADNPLRSDLYRFTQHSHS
ncbi:hypothetical protein [Ferrovum myxofaciens]|nr:hypothetical protein [Ferrovum myxofaciens]